MEPPKPLLRHRIPVRLRHYWKLLAVLAAVIVVTGALFGGVRIRPYITGDTTVMTSQITDNIAGRVDLFDPTVAHSLTVDITAAEYRDMLDTYARDDEKKWVSADVTIDGTVINDVAVRLKGNSTLMALRGDEHKPPWARDGAPPPPPDFVFVSADPDDPASLPLLLSFNEFVDGRGYQGMTELSVRPGAPVLNEALALSLTRDTGQPTQRYAYVTYTINGRTTTRLVLEHPDETYAETLFDSPGYLYKADAFSYLEFVGTDQSAYAEQFKQINSADNGNLQPIINFVQWLDGADQAEFDAHLADWLEVESFARYVATQNLLCNGDDMAGPGQNYYLWYDLDTKKFTVVSWDLNLAMQGKPDIGPFDKVSMPGPPPGMRLPGAPGDAPPGDGPPGDGPPEMAPPFDGPPPGPDGRRPRIGNPLKSRFLESSTFRPLYEQAYWELFDRIYGNGRAHALLDEIAATVPVTPGLTKEDLQAAVARLHDWIDARTAALRAKRPR